MDNLNKTGAVRSADADLFSYTSLPMLGLMGVARTAVEGKTKYGRLNYKQGMPVHQYLDHAMHHIIKYTAGDRSEPNLEHAAWGLLAAIESALLYPELNSAHDLGPGSTITPAIQAHLDSIKDDLAARRKAGEFAKVGQWRLADLPDVQALLNERERQSVKGGLFSDPEYDPLTLEMADFLRSGKVTDRPPCLKYDQEFCPGDCCSTDAEAGTPVRYFAPDSPEHKALVKMGTSERLDDAEAAALTRLMEVKLKVTPAEMEKFEAEKLAPMTDAEMAAKVYRVPSLTDAAKAESRLAAGWDMIDKPGSIETHQFRRGHNGKLTLIGHTTTFKDGSTIDRMSELAVPDSAPEDSRGGSAALYRQIYTDKAKALIAEVEGDGYRKLSDAIITLPDPTARRSQAACDVEAEASHAEWADERHRAAAYHAEYGGAYPGYLPH
jgi:hypothetical protein